MSPQGAEISKKVTSDDLSSADGEFSWGQTTDDEHQACLGKMATKDPTLLRN